MIGIFIFGHFTTESFVQGRHEFLIGQFGHVQPNEFFGRGPNDSNKMLIAILDDTLFIKIDDSDRCIFENLFKQFFRLSEFFESLFPFSDVVSIGNC